MLCGKFVDFACFDAIKTRVLKKSGYNGELTMEIFNFLSRFHDALVSDALVLSAKVGRYLIDLYNKAQILNIKTIAAGKACRIFF